MTHTVRRPTYSHICISDAQCVIRKKMFCDIFNKEPLTTIFIKKKCYSENFVQVQIGILGGDRAGSREG